ncbi:MAG: hypothetical protein J6V84_03580, partial [Clostridia bacterium]|nr:hypothetical protein [Clostridia bacterium]
MKALKRIALFTLCLTLCLSLASCEALLRGIMRNPLPDFDASGDFVMGPAENSSPAIESHPVTENESAAEP